MYQGTVLQLAGPFFLPTGVATPVQWSSAYIDTAAMWSPATPSRITIPAHVNIVRLRGAGLINTAANTTLRSQIRMNGGALVSYSNTAAVPRPGGPTASPPLAVAAGDYFEIEFLPGANVNLWEIAATHFACDILQAAP